MVDGVNDNYKVGPGRPPRHTQFKPGESGNTGRKRTKHSLAEIFDKILAEKLTLNENGKPKKYTREELFMRMVVAKAMKGCPQFSKMVMAYLERRPVESTAKATHKANDVLMKELMNMMKKDD